MAHTDAKAIFAIAFFIALVAGAWAITGTWMGPLLLIGTNLGAKGIAMLLMVGVIISLGNPTFDRKALDRPEINFLIFGLVHSMSALIIWKYSGLSNAGYLAVFSVLVAALHILLTAVLFPKRGDDEPALGIGA